MLVAEDIIKTDDSYIQSTHYFYQFLFIQGYQINLSDQSS